MRFSRTVCRGIAMVAAFSFIAGAPVMAGDNSAPETGQIAQSGPLEPLICRGGGDAGFTFTANKNNYRELCVNFRWVKTPLQSSKPPAGYCGFANRGPVLKERRIRLFCQSISRTVQIRRWPPGSRQRYQFLSTEAPYLAKLGNKQYNYRLRVSNQGTSFKVDAVLDLAKKKPKKHAHKHGRKTQ